MKYANQITEYISNTDSISFMASMGYKVLGLVKGKTRDMDKYRLINENKCHAKPFTLHRRHFLQQVEKYHQNVVKVVKIDSRAPTDACDDYDLFHYGML